MDIITIQFKSGEKVKLPDISLDIFDKYIWEEGSNDIEYEKYKRDHKMIELTDLNEQTIQEITLIIEQPYRGRVLKFKCIYDSNNDEFFNEDEYFNL
jgi:hypothetical protein